MSRVRLEQITKSFPDSQGNSIRAVDRVSLEVASGSFLVLAGPSGSGKTSLLRMIAGLEPPDSGAIFIGDKSMNKVAAADREVALVFQTLALYPHMTVRGNLEFGLRARKINAAGRRSRIEEATSTMGLDNLMDRLPEELSGGQRQRVALARAIVSRPRVLLLDEPLSNLDASLRWEMRAELLRVHKEFGWTTIYVTHDQVEAMTLGDTLAVLKEGSLQQCATPSAVYENPVNAFVAGFVGLPGMNLITGELKCFGELFVFKPKKKSGDATSTEMSFARIEPRTLSQRLLTERTIEVILGFRPEHCTLGRGLGQAGQVELETLQFPAECQTVQFAGADSYLGVRAGQSAFVIREPSSSAVCEGQQVLVNIALRDLRWFEAKTGEAIH